MAEITKIEDCDGCELKCTCGHECSEHHNPGMMDCENSCCMRKTCTCDQFEAIRETDIHLNKLGSRAEVVIEENGRIVRKLI